MNRRPHRTPRDPSILPARANCAPRAACVAEPLEGRRLLSVAIGLSGKSLFTFDTANPGVTLAKATVSGLRGRESLIGIDFRPSDGRLYAVSSSSRVYRVDPGTGRATRVDAASPVVNAMLAGTYFGIDFDPVADQIRIVSDTGANIRFDPDTGVGAQTDAPLAYAAGDVNAGRLPHVTALGNSRAVNGTTTSYGVDTDTNTLVTLGSVGGSPDTPAGGLVSTVGVLTVDPGSPAGFDVDTNGAADANGTADVGYATFVKPAPNHKKPDKYVGPSTFYRVDLTTGAATAVGEIKATKKPVTDVAIVPAGDTVLAVDAKNRLYTFDSNLPSLVTSRVSVNGLVTGEKLVGVDVRPANGLAYAFTDQGRLYALDTTTGLATTIGQTAVPPAKRASVGFDFNPVADLARVVDTAGENFRVNPADGQIVDADVTMDGAQFDAPLAYVGGDPAAGRVPSVSGIAYTNSVVGTTAAAATTLYAIDSRQGTLTTIGSADGATSPNTGQLFTVGGLGLTIKDPVGFDIVSQATDPADPADPAAVTNRAFAVFKAAGQKLSLYTIDLATGAASSRGTIGKGVVPVGIAVLPG